MKHKIISYIKSLFRIIGSGCGIIVAATAGIYAGFISFLTIFAIAELLGILEEAVLKEEDTNENK